MVALALLMGAILPIDAQEDTLSVTQVAEYDIGFDCPVTSTLDPSGDSVWVLMDSCHNRGFSLHQFNIADGTLINSDDHADALVSLDTGYVYSPTMPLAFTPDGELDILYNDAERYDTLNLRVREGRVDTAKSEALTSLLRGFTEYPETTVYNTDHTLAVAFGETTFHVLDLQAMTEILAIEADGEAFAGFPQFSADGQLLYIAQLNNPDDFEDNTAVLYVYHLPDGALLRSSAVPSFILWISPNDQYAAAQLGDTGMLVVIELETGRSSPPIPINEAPHPVTECLNSGNDMSDVNFMTRGELPISGLNWLPDSSGFVTAHTYLGDGAGGGTICIFNYSRLRHYALQGDD